MPAQTLIHVHPGADELGRVYQPALAIAATPGAFLAALADALPRRTVRAARRRACRLPRVAGAAAGSGRARPLADRAWLDERLPDDAILTNGAGNYSTWLHRLYRYRGFRTQLAPYVGSMGYGVPAAVAAKVVHPERIVVSWNGDGCFLMNGQELATAVQYGLAVVFVVVDNGMYGTIRMHQERTYPAASTAPRSSIPISRRWRAPTVRTAKQSRAPPNSRRRSSARSPSAGRRCCTSSSTRRR